MQHVKTLVFQYLADIEQMPHTGPFSAFKNGILINLAQLTAKKKYEAVEFVTIERIYRAQSTLLHRMITAAGCS